RPGGTLRAALIRQMEEVVHGIRRLTLPLPTGPRHVHCYVVDGTLFDTGLGLGEVDWSGFGIERVAITHMHPDHVGGAASAASAAGAAVHQGAFDYEQCERVWGSPDWPERMAAWFRRNGVPPPVADELIEQGHAFAPFISYARDPELLREGDEVAGWSVVELPGHADGHVGFLRDGVLVAGDHLLAGITPAIGLYPESRPDPLADYLASLRRTIDLQPRVAVAALILLTAFFVAAEYGLVTSRRTRIIELEHQGNRRARAVVQIVADPPRFIAAMQLGVTLTSLGIGALGEQALTHAFDPVMSTVVAVVLGYLLLTFFHVVIGELVPKGLALGHSETVALA